MKINLVTLFPEFFTSPLSCGLMQKAVETGIAEFIFHNPRSYTDDKRHSVDDRPYGGGPGMVMQADPLARALRAIEQGPGRPPRIVLLSPRGRPFTQRLARELAREKSITLLCGRYEGIDERLHALFPLEEISLGDFILNGGESAALAVCEAICRLLPGFMGHEDSALEESFSAGLLEYPHYTRPEHYAGLRVPEELLSGDHAAIARWRGKEALLATLVKRPELLEQALISRKDRDTARALPRKLLGPGLSLALLHYPVLDQEQKSGCSSLTNLDVHDLARSARTYGLGAFFVITPLEDQRLLLQELLAHWISGPGSRSNPDRGQALSTVMPVADLEEALALAAQKHGQRPQIWGSSAQGEMTLTFEAAREALRARPAVLLLGTGHGLAPEVMARCDAVLPPLRWIAPYNHLSVRCAGTVLLDRLLGEWG